MFLLRASMICISVWNILFNALMEPRVWTQSYPDARRRKICNRSNLMVVRIENFSATPQVGDFAFKHYL